MAIKNQVIIIRKEPPAVPKIALIAIIVLATSIVTLAILTSLKHPAAPTQEIISGKEIIVGVDNVIVYVPKDTAIMPGVISVTSREPNLLSPIGEPEWLRPQVVNVEYRDTEGALYSHVKFSNPVLVCFKVAQEQWQSYSTYPEEFQVQYYDEVENPHRWVALPMVTHPDQYQLCGQTDHFSIFALAIKPRIGIPVTGVEPTPADSLLTEFFNLFLPVFSSDSTVTLTPTQGLVTATKIPTQIVATSTIVPSATANPTIVPTNTATDIPPTATDVPTNTATDIPPTETDVPPTATDVPPTETDVPPTATDPPTEPPTDVPTDVPTEVPIVAP